MRTLFDDRQDAGRKLAAELRARHLAGGGADYADVIVLALPRGGVPVAAEIAAALAAPLDVVVVRKLGAPGQEELALGAIAAGSTTVLNQELISSLGIDRAAIERVKASELEELRRREQSYRRGLPPLDVAERSVIVVDDGVATGATMLAALEALRQAGAATITVAVPLAPPETSRAISALADEFVALHVLGDLRSVGQWYADFSQTSDDEVSSLLTAAAAAGRQDRGRRQGRA